MLRVFICLVHGKALGLAQSMAWFEVNDIPKPGAIGIFCAGDGEFGAGDTAVITRAFGAEFNHRHPQAIGRRGSNGRTACLRRLVPLLLCRYGIA